jgi:hypothetical protein
MLRLKDTVFALLLCTALVPGMAVAQEEQKEQVNGAPRGVVSGAAVPAIAGPGTSTNEGHFICTAAINANGTVFSGHYVNASQTGRVLASSGGCGTTPANAGCYQVSFNTAGSPCPHATIAAGWFRVCQIDTLAFGTLSGFCTVADRAPPGPAGAIWVETFSNSGPGGSIVSTALPFTLSVSR